MQKVYSQKTNAATKAKWNRMCANRGWVSSTKYLRVGFAEHTVAFIVFNKSK